MAEERARQKAREARGKPAERPPGNGFMTERARAKEALRAEVSTYTGEGIHKISFSKVGTAYQYQLEKELGREARRPAHAAWLNDAPATSSTLGTLAFA
jgi:hypothetical protein